MFNACALFGYACHIWSRRLPVGISANVPTCREIAKNWAESRQYHKDTQKRDINRYTLEVQTFRYFYFHGYARLLNFVVAETF